MKACSTAFFMALLLATVVIPLGGCGSELSTVALTPGQRHNRASRTISTNLREASDDWDRFWLLDEPARLSQYPIP